MPKTATPRLNGFEPHAHEVSLTMLFPVAPRVGVTVQGEEQWAHGIDNCRVPMRGPLMPGKGNPGGRALEFRLSVGLGGISLLPGMAGKQGVAIGRLGSLHCCRAGGDFLKDCSSTVFISDIVALVDDTSLELARGISFRGLAVLFDTNLEDFAEMSLLAKGLNTGFNDASRFHRMFIPTATGTCKSQAIPFLTHRCLSVRGPAPFNQADVAGDAGEARRRTMRNLDTMRLGERGTTGIAGGVSSS